VLKSLVQAMLLPALDSRQDLCRTLHRRSARVVSLMGGGVWVDSNIVRAFKSRIQVDAARAGDGETFQRLRRGWFAIAGDSMLVALAQAKAERKKTINVGSTLECIAFSYLFRRLRILSRPIFCTPGQHHAGTNRSRRDDRAT